MRQLKIIFSIITLFGILIFSGCLKDQAGNQPFQTFAPSDFLDDGHILSGAAAEDMDSAALANIYQDVYDDDNLWSMRSLLVFRHGKLVAESYLKSEMDITQRHLVWSCTKQVIGILTGIAIENGMINDIDDPISDYFDSELNGHEDKADISIRNLITMQSGIDYDNDGVGGQTDKLLRQIPDKSVDFILDLPLNATQGTSFNYNDGNPHLISAILQKLAGKPTDEWADDVLFSKIEMKNYNWVRYKDGITLGGFGIETTPREMAKIALCVADSGRWKGTQVINPDWIEEMTASHVQLDDPGYSFGYFWWINTDRDIQYMAGHGGQYAFIVPGKELVVVMTAYPNTGGDYQIITEEAIPIVDRIIAACN